MVLYWPTVTVQFYLCVYVSFVCQYVASLASVITTFYYVEIIFYRQVWYRALSMHCVCIQSSGIILTPRLPLCNFVSFAASIAELADGEKLLTHLQSLTHIAYLMRQELKLVLRNIALFLCFFPNSL